MRLEFASQADAQAKADSIHQRMIANVPEYAKSVAAGQTTALKRGKRTIPFAEYFWQSVDKRRPDECWNWRGKPSSGGYCQVGRKHRMAHRVAWELANSKTIPEGMCVMHSCDNPPCCNPAHLSLGTHAENMADMERKGRARSGKTKLTSEQALAIRADSDSQRAIAAKFGISRRNVRSIKNGDTWRRVGSAP